MAYENIEVSYPNLCLGPQIGTFCSINMDNVITIMQVKNATGGLIANFALSSNIINELVGFEYVGPENLSAMQDELTFFTLEKISSSVCIIKRWETNASTFMLDLKQQIIKSTSGHYYYDVLTMAVEHYRRTVDQSTPAGQNYVEVNDSSRIASGDRIILGPSGDTDNIGATEYVSVSYVSGNKVYLNSNLVYEYVIGDQFCFYNNIYLFSALGYDGDTSNGTLFKLDATNGALITFNTDGVYQKITAAKWSIYTDAIGTVAGTNLLYIRPYYYYLNWRSQFLNNISSGKTTTFEVFDIAFEDHTIYKLMQRITRKDDNGTLTSYSWSPKYNFQQDTLLPYSDSIKLYTVSSKMIGQNDTTDILIQVRDQFGVGLQSLDVSLYMDGDLGAVFDPPDGKATTDINGEATIGYTSGTNYDGFTEIRGKVAGSSALTGSEWVWGETNIGSIISFTPDDLRVWQDKEHVAESYLVTQIEVDFEIDFKLHNKTFFTTPGGDWINPSSFASEVSTMLPALAVGVNDGPQKSFYRGWSPGEEPDVPFENKITQVLDFESEKYIAQHKEVSAEVMAIQLKELVSDLQISQLKHSQHTYWVDGNHEDELWTDVTIDQFVFVEDAIPTFWSEKNPINTNIWIRLRPFAFDLNINRVKFMVKEVSYKGVVGFNDYAYTPQCTLTAFDAGGGVYGFEILYNPTNDFHHNAIVYVHIEVYDEATPPNLIYVDYWFMVIPDYRFPYLENLNPSRDQTDVEVDTNIYFEIKDEGVGVDIDTLQLYVNSRVVTPTTIVRVDDNHYKVTYDPTEDFYFNKEVTVHVQVNDASGFANQLNDSYRFYTKESDDVVFTDFNPAVCKRGMPKFSDVSFLALGGGGGVDRDTIRVQIHDRDFDDRVTIVPVVYRTE